MKTWKRFLLPVQRQACTDSQRRAGAPLASGEKGSAGARYHGVAEEGVPFREIAGVIGRRLDVPVVSKAPEETINHFGWFAHFSTLDNPASSQRTRELLGWKPKQPGLIPDLDRESYFDT